MQWLLLKLEVPPVLKIALAHIMYVNRIDR